MFDSKGEYLAPVQSFGCEFHYYKPGSSDNAIQLDIFQIPDNLNADEHLNFLYALFLQVVGNTSTPQMERLIYLSIKEVLNNNGSFKDFILCLENPTSIGLIGAHLELSSSGIMNRILPLTTGIAGSCFNVTKSTINYDILLNNNVIVDLSPFEDLENNATRKIFTNVLYYYMLHYLRKHREKIRQPADIQNVIVVEEAQKIVPISFEGKTEIRSILGMSAWTARAYGISMVFVGTDPVVESSILSNTGLSIIFYSKSDPYQIAKLLQLSFDDYKNLLPLLSIRQIFLVSNKSKINLCKSFTI